VVPYPVLIFSMEGGWTQYLVQALFVMVLVIACANVATLVFARTAARENEIAVRAALGAGRARIVVQLFVEALVLASVAGAVGLAAAWWGLRALMDAVAAENGPLLFWWDFDLSPGTVVYAAGLTVLAAVIAGIVPALKVTQGGLQTRLRQAAAGGSGLRFGRLWTGIIVAQVAISVAVLPILVSQGWNAWRDQAAEPSYAAREYLTAKFEMDREVPPSAAAAAYEARFTAAFAERRREFARRLAAEPGVVAVTFASVLPGMGHPTIQVADAAVSPDATAQHAVRTAMVEPGFFDAFDAPVIAGRAFHDGDLEPGRDAVIVNQSFVRQVLGGRDPIGRRVREVREPGRSAQPGQPPARLYEIVGVVRDLGMSTEGPDLNAGLYRPATPGGDEMRVAVRVAGGPPSALAPRLRAIALAVDPAVHVDEVLSLDEVGRSERMAMRLLAAVIGLFTIVALLLSSTGIYAMMAFTVSQRTREIGIRAALGAHPGRIVGAIFARALRQLAAGAAVGAVGATALVLTGLSDQLAQDGPWLMLGVAALVVAVGLVACAVPARRALRIQPTEALRQVG
jgi:predicted permease